MRGPGAGARLTDHGDQVLRRAVEIKLELAVLIDGAEGRDRRRALALFAEALAPELHIPGGEARQAVAVRPHHADPDAALLGKSDGDGRADSRREVVRLAPREQRLDHGTRALAERLDVETAGKRRKQADIGEAREAAADIGIMGQRRNGESLAEVAEAVGLALSPRARSVRGKALGSGSRAQPAAPPRWRRWPGSGSRACCRISR